MPLLRLSLSALLLLLHLNLLPAPVHGKIKEKPTAHSPHCSHIQTRKHTNSLAAASIIITIQTAAPAKRTAIDTRGGGDSRSSS